MTLCERSFLRKHTETDDVQAQVRAWRECGCADGSDVAVKTRIAALVVRADAVAFLQSLRERAAIYARAMEKRGAEERNRVAVIREEMQEDAELEAYLLLKAEATAVRTGDRKSVQGFSKLYGEFKKPTPGAAGKEGLPYEEAARRLAAAKQSVETPVFVAPPAPGNEDTPNA